jgi:hypothetical protein
MRRPHPADADVSRKRRALRGAANRATRPSGDDSAKSSKQTSDRLVRRRSEKRIFLTKMKVQ